jgi:histidine triad (HIT) family protein
VPPTVFTRIVRREIPAAIVDEDELAIAFMDAGQVNPGHVIVATRREAATLLELTDAEAAAVFVMAARIARRVQAAFAPAGLTVLQANGVAGWQTVPHFHLHVLPRHEDDGVGLVWPRKDPPFETLQALARRIADARTAPPAAV